MGGSAPWRRLHAGCAIALLGAFITKQSDDRGSKLPIVKILEVGGYVLNVAVDGSSVVGQVNLGTLWRGKLIITLETTLSFFA